MIEREKIGEWVEESLREKGYFLVELSISKNNSIYIEVDADQGIPISYCVELSHIIESHIDREEIDFELEVASATLGQPFKVQRQYQKNIGKELAIITTQGIKEEGVLTAINEHSLVLKVIRKKKIAEKKKKEEQEEDLIIAFSDIKEARNIIRFK